MPNEVETRSYQVLLKLQVWNRIHIYFKPLSFEDVVTVKEITREGSRSFLFSSTCPLNILISVSYRKINLSQKILWPPDAKNRLIGKDPDAVKDWRQEEKGMTGDEMVGWHHRLYRHEFEQALGVCDGQGSLALLQSMGSQRVRQDWVTELNCCKKKELLISSAKLTPPLSLPMLV